jgi:hypothetical protein
MTKRCTTATLVGIGLIVWSVCGATPVFGSTLLVSNTFDHGPGSLRDAIANAAPGDTIQANVAGAITLTGGPLIVRAGRAADTGRRTGSSSARSR